MSTETDEKISSDIIHVSKYYLTNSKFQIKKTRGANKHIVH